MDVDAAQPQRNSPYITFFDVSPATFPWHDPRPEQIRLRRAAMDDSLIFDILLHSGGVSDTYAVYPPHSPAGLQKLLDTIEGSQYDALKKDCLVYFLLKWYQDGRERSFQEQRCIPPQFAALADAYWHLDTGINVPRAVAILSDARLNRDYASKIIRAISVSPDASALVRRYIQTAKPLLVEPPDIESYALALADSSILESWQFSRTFSESNPMRARLFKRILEWSVTPKPRPISLAQLLALPFSTFEEAVLNEFVQKPPAALPFSSVAILQDLICVRLIQGGRYAEAIKLDRQFSSTTSPKNLKDTRDRSKMVQDVYAALPSVERTLVDLELDHTALKTPALFLKPVSPERRRAPPPAVAQEPEDLSLSQSWEEVRMPEALVSKSTPLREARVPTTPRFGNGIAAFQASTTTTPAPAPILPLNFNGLASGSKATPRKNLPLSASVLGSAAAANPPRVSLSGIGTRMAFGTSNAIASPASGMKLPPVRNGATPSHAFVSAGRQQNAFYQPPPLPKTNGVKRAFEEDSANRSPERVVNGSAHTHITDVEMEVETEKEDESFEKDTTKTRTRRGKKSDVTEGGEENVLQYSVFGGEGGRGGKAGRRSSPGQQTLSKGSATTKRGGRKAQPPGTFITDDEDEDAMMEMEEEREEEEEETRKTSARTRASRSTRTSSKAQTQAAAKPPAAKKARQVKEKDLSRSIPGAYEGEEQDEEDRVAPLPAPAKRPVRKARSSASVVSEEGDGEGMQTRRRSSRLTTGGNASAHSGGSPEAAAPKTRKGTRAGGARKKR